jgi:glucosamine--fructose-6-phosphate aminotransferase (isomerizing)
MYSRMLEEIREQPEVLTRVLDEGWPEVLDAGRALRARGFRFAMLAARGTSDNAALYAKYLLENFLGVPAALASPSSFTLYGARMDLRDALVVGVSQSGESKDVLETLRRARGMGAPTLSVTNDEASSLAEAADFHLFLHAGDEKSVAATKTYTAELLALYMLVEALRGEKQPSAEAQRLPEWSRAVLRGEWEGAERYRYADYMTVVSRGYNLATAKETALKLMETSYLVAGAFSAADLRHGPIAMIGRDFPVLAIVPPGEARPGVLDLIGSLAIERGAELLVVGDGEATAEATARFQIPVPCPEELSPVLYAIPPQLLAEGLSRLKGRDPDAPRGLSKVTETW